MIDVNKKLPQPREKDPYRYIRFEDIPRIFFTSSQQPPVDQLVWACKSKGRRRRRRQQQQQQQDVLEDKEKEKEEGEGEETKLSKQSCCFYFNSSTTSNSATTQQRLELFLRARVLPPEQGEPPISSDPPPHCPSDEDHLDCPPRIRVQYPMGSTYHVRSDHLIPILCDEHNTHRRLVIAVQETPHYRKLCVVHTLPHESFLEIGSDLGFNLQRVYEASDEETTIISSSSSSSNPNTNNNKKPWLVGIDKSAYSIRTASESFPHLTFVQWDPLEQSTSVLWERMISQQEHEHGSNDISTNNPSSTTKKESGSTRDCCSFYFDPDVVAVDINGSRELPAVLACLDAIWNRHNWKPRLVIVKSRTLHASLSLATSSSTV